jgi:hypothetical protein
MRNIVKASQVSDDSEFGADYRTQIIGTLDLRKMEKALDAIDHAEIRRRRNQYDRLHFEAILASERDKGISFTEMLLLLARYKIIKEDEALRYVFMIISRDLSTDGRIVGSRNSYHANIRWTLLRISLSWNECGHCWLSHTLDGNSSLTDKRLCEEGQKPKVSYILLHLLPRWFLNKALL